MVEIHLYINLQNFEKILWIILLIACVFQVIVISTGRLNNPLNIDNDYMQYFEMTPNENYLFHNKPFQSNL